MYGMIFCYAIVSISMLLNVLLESDDYFILCVKWAFTDQLYFKISDILGMLAWDILNSPLSTSSYFMLRVSSRYLSDY